MDAAIFGLIVADLIAEPFNLRAPPAPGGLQLINSISLTTGGNVSNTGLAMAKLGSEVAAAGLVGNDILGAAVLQRLQQGGLNTDYVFPTNAAQTSATVVAVEPGGERVFFHTPGATTLLDSEAFRRCFTLFQQCQYLQIGYFGLLPALTPHLPALLGALRQHAPKLKIALDTVNPPADRQLLLPILPHLDIFCPSRTEAAALTGETDHRQMAKALRQHMPEGALVGIKLDAEGCYLERGADSVFCSAYKVKVIDTTGAGDTWFGGLLTALIHHMPLEKAGLFANRAAADCCTALGASAGVRSFEQTLARL